MIVLLSPSKTINPKPETNNAPLTYPTRTKAINQLVRTIVTLGPKLGKVFKVSDKIAELNRERFNNWDYSAQPSSAERAAWTYRGEVYFGLSIEQFTPKQIEYANSHIRIISGLYGLLKPTDAILPYRLEMSTSLSGEWGKNLYDFWGSKLADELMTSKPSVILNCSSEEYIKAIRPHLPDSVHLISPKFLHNSSTGLKPKMAFAKYSRGLMARWVVENKVTKTHQLEGFNVEGYTFSTELSEPNTPVFVAPKGFSIKGRFTTK